IFLYAILARCLYNLLAFVNFPISLITLASRITNLQFGKKGANRPNTVFRCPTELTTISGLFLFIKKINAGIPNNTLFLFKKTVFTLFVQYAASDLFPMTNNWESKIVLSKFWAIKDNTRSAPPALRDDNINSILNLFIVGIEF